MITDFRIPIKERLLEVINASVKAPLPLKISDISFGLPEATTLHQRNTKIKITANVGSKKSMTRTLFYNRVPLSRYFAEIVTNELATNTYETTHDILPYLDSQKQIVLEESEVVLEPILPNAQSVTITVNDTSIGWLGSATLSFISVAPMRGFALDDGSIFVTDSNATFLLDDDGILIFAP